MTPLAERRSLVLRGVLDLCLLALLEDSQVYGYELTSKLADRGLAVGNGTAYPLLGRLQRLGLIAVELQPSSTGPPRKYYTLSTAGREALADGRTQWSEIANAVTSVLHDGTVATKPVADVRKGDTT